MKPWKTLRREVLITRPWIEVSVEQVETGSGHVIDEYHLIGARDWCLVVCITADQQLVLARQYRHGVQLETLEFPAGAVDPGERPRDAAVRELREETGFEAPTWTPLQVVAPETTRHGHRAHLFLATGARRTAAQDLDASEDVVVELVPMVDEGPAGTLQRLARGGELLHGVHVGAALLAALELATT